MPLDSDVADADSHLNVEFYTCETKDKIGPDGQKLTNYEGKPFVRIKNPGDKTAEFDQPARDYYIRRFPRQWLNYQMQNQPDAGMIGTPLDTWHREFPEELVADQLRELHILGFRTVEQVAMCSDHQVQRIGMGGNGVRVRAKADLDRRNRSQRDIELEDTKRELAEMRAMLTQLVQNGSIQGDPPKNKGGRPKGSVNRVHDDDASTGATGDERVGGSDS